MINLNQKDIKIRSKWQSMIWFCRWILNRTKMDDQIWTAWNLNHWRFDFLGLHRQAQLQLFVRWSQVAFWVLNEHGQDLNRGSLDLNFTLLHWANSPLTWHTQIFILLLQENQVLQGKCGGYCGTCVPEPHHGLKLDLLPP